MAFSAVMVVALPPIQGRYLDIWIKHGRTWHIVVDRPGAAPRAPRQM
jgi:hypothetical protein